ncbi:MAG TPA: gamma-glutamyltransferase, partial [Candidatus Latescibacteria bacterium]|nr:gamma-glutamyltransferase [Candidatus Latescibacterota bacterium]
MEVDCLMAFTAKGTTHRPTPTGRRGMIACAHPLASLAGMRILMHGGNAIDAAVATAAALNVVEPYMSGIGGLGYMHIYSAAHREHKILDYVGLTPHAAELSLYDDDAKQDRGPLSPLVPGACGGWFEALRRYGTMDAAAVFGPAIEYAEQGFAITVKNAEFIDSNVPDLRKYPSTASTYLIDGRSPQPGEVLIQKDLAETLRTVAASGPEVFYAGHLADIIAAFMSETGGLLSKQDLTEFKPVWLDPISIDYRGHRVFTPPLPCQAVQYLETLNIMEGFDVADMGHNTAAT